MHVQALISIHSFIGEILKDVGVAHLGCHHGLKVCFIYGLD